MPILSAKNLLLRIGANAPLLDNVCFQEHLAEGAYG